jgi:hypothetical protein
LQEVKYYNQNKEEKGYPGRFVAEFFDVNYRTLARQISNKAQSRKGKPPALSKDLEDLLADTILRFTLIAFHSHHQTPHHQPHSFNQPRYHLVRKYPRVILEGCRLILINE